MVCMLFNFNISWTFLGVSIIYIVLLIPMGQWDTPSSMLVPRPVIVSIDKDVGCNMIVPHAHLSVINSIMTLVAGVIHSLSSVS